MYFKTLIKRCLYCISPKLLANIQYYGGFRKFVNWNNPRDLNELILVLKCSKEADKWVPLADKYLVRNYVQEKGLGDLLVALYGVWDKPEDIEWESLPNQFVIKANNGSGDVHICRDKALLDVDSEIYYYKKILNSSFSLENGEGHYSKMKPCIIIEELLDVNKQPIETDSLIDYKIWCFNGKPYCIWACYNRSKESVEVATYDLDWNLRPEVGVSTHHYKSAKKKLPRPKSLNKMLEAASILSEGFPEVRVDLYEVDNKPYFGELTFSSAGGFMNFYTPEFLVELGNQVKR